VIFVVEELTAFGFVKGQYEEKKLRKPLLYHKFSLSNAKVTSSSVKPSAVLPATRTILKVSED